MILNKKPLITALAVTGLSTTFSVTAYANVSLPDSLYKEHYELSSEYVREGFDNDGWDIEYVNANELNYLYCSGDFANLGYNVSGATVYDIKTIYISDAPGYGEVALNHEMGHFVDYSYYTFFGIQPSRTDEFYQIYKKEAAGSYLFESYELSDVSEYFAQSYWAYVEHKDDLELFYPQTFAYMEKIIDGYAAAVENGFNAVYDDSCFMRSGPSAPHTRYNQQTKKLTVNN